MSVAALTVLSIPSPSTGIWYLGPFPLRGYALAIILGIVAAIWIGERRWVARGGRAGDIQDLAIWAVPFGLVGGRLYHVLTDSELYFGAGGNADQGALRLARRPRHLGRDRARRARRGHRRPAQGHQAAAGARRDGARACWSRRRSAAGATGSTRSCSASRPTCRGALEIDAAHRPLGLRRPGRPFHPTFLYESPVVPARRSRWSSGPTAGSASATAGWSRST